MIKPFKKSIFVEKGGEFFKPRHKIDISAWSVYKDDNYGNGLCVVIHGRGKTLEFVLPADEILESFKRIIV